MTGHAIRALRSETAPSRTAVLAILAVSLSTACTTVDPAKDTLRRNLSSRWTTNEASYEDAPLHERVGRNFRDGLVGVVDNVAQGAFSVGLTVGYTGFISQKTGTVVGDVVGLIDDNEVTEHVAKGIVSRQFLRFGSGANGYPDTLGALHEQTFDVWDDETRPQPRTLDYVVANKTFHTRVYGRPSGLATLGAIVLGDFIIRPAGNLMLAFSWRGAQEKCDEAAFWLMERALRLNFY